LSAAGRLFNSDRACVLAVVLAGLLMLVPGLGSRDLWDPDEPRTAAVTAAIATGGAWAAPRLDGRPWLEKPPLYYWLAAAASRAAGRVDEATVRLPANAAAVLCAVVVFLLGRSLWGRRAGVLAAIVLVTSFDIMIEARWARPDMLLGLILTFAALAAWKVCAHQGATRVPSAWAAAFWAAIGLGVLAKGPVALLPIAGVLVFAAATRRGAVLRALGPWWGVAVAVVPVAAWVLAWGAATGTPFPAGAVLARFAQRLTDGIHHAHPPLHLMTTLPLALVPWVALLPAAIAETWPRREGDRDERAVFILSLVITYVALFAMSAEKRGVYLLPVVPLTAILIGRLWDMRLYPWVPPPPARAIAAGLAAWLLVIGGATAWVLARLPSQAPALLRPAALLAGAALLAAAAPLALWRRAGAGGAIGLFAAGAALCSLLATHAVLPAIEPYKSPREFGRRVAAAAGADPVGIFRHPHRGIAWYAGRPLEVLPTIEALAAFLSGPPRALVVSEAQAWEAAAPRAGAGARIVERGRVGHRAFVLVEPDGAARAGP